MQASISRPIENSVASFRAVWGARIPQYRQIWKDTVNDLLSKVNRASKNDNPLQDLMAQCQAVATLAASQSIPTGGPDDWNAEAHRYTNQIVKAFNNMAAQQLGKALDASTPTAEALSSLSASLRRLAVL